MGTSATAIASILDGISDARLEHGQLFMPSKPRSLPSIFHNYGINGIDVIYGTIDCINHSLYHSYTLIPIGITMVYAIYIPLFLDQGTTESS